eukprot:RCo008323
MSSSVLNPAVQAALAGIASHNSSRMDSSRVMSAFIYLFVALGMLSMSGVLALLLGWQWLPFRILLRRRGRTDPSTVMWNTVVWLVVLVAIVFIVASAAGLPGWFIVSVVYFFGCVGMMIWAGVIHCKTPPKYAAVPVLPVEDPAEAAAKPPGAPISAFTSTMVAPSRYPQRPTWTASRQHMGRHQLSSLLLCVMSTSLCTIITVILFYAWRVPDYQLWQGSQNIMTVEALPQLNAKTLALMYSWDQFATNIRLGIYAKWYTNYCGSEYTKYISPSDRPRKLYNDFIKAYSINMAMFSPADYMKYNSTNELFTRKLNLSIPWRPIDYDAGNFVSPCDCRVLAYPNLPTAKIWIKGDSYSVSDLLDGEAALTAKLSGGYIVIGRLSLQDYHRINVPVEGNITLIKTISGSYWGVSPEAARSENKVFLNLRTVVVIQTPGGHSVAVIFVGATCVASIVLNSWVVVGATTTLGQELGYMQYGGSTMIMLTEPGAVEVDPALREISTYPVETYTHINSAIGNCTSG